jgi:hypothetical protein
MPAPSMWPLSWPAWLPAWGGPSQNNGVQVTLSNPILSWHAARPDSIACIAAADIEHEDDGVTIFVWPKGGSRGGTPPILISPQTGLIGYPAYTHSGLALLNRFNPAIGRGGLIKVESSLTPACAALGASSACRMCWRARRQTGSGSPISRLRSRPMPPSDKAAAAPIQPNEARGGDYNAQAFLVQSLLAKQQTAAVVQVKAVRGGGMAPVGFVDVQPMVAQVDGAGQTTPHGIVHNLPFFRLQGGANAVVIDPQPGDIGLAVFSSRDISAVKAISSASSARFKAPLRHGRRALYLAASSTARRARSSPSPPMGIQITSPTAVKVNAPTVAVTGDLTVTGEITAGAGTAGSVTVRHHVHPTNGQPPTPGT